MNMKVLKPSRKPVQPGDIFVYQIQDDCYHYGRVIKVEDTGGPIHGGFILLYFYKATSPVKEQIPMLHRDDLLLPPIISDRYLWLKGYFVTLMNQALASDDILPKHCFWDFAKRVYCDDLGNQLPERNEPCGEYGFTGYKVIDNEISDALGVPRS